jgi:hypothetical protein
MSPDPHEPIDVAVIGGGPAGSSVAVFCARYGLETVVFDRGRSSLRECAHLENYLGFPAGIDVETFYELAHAQVRESGGRIRESLVEAVQRESGESDDESDTFRVETQADTADAVRVTTVVAATRYDGEYLRPVLGDGAFRSDGEGAGERLDPDVADTDGRTPIEGLYLATPTDEVDEQVVQAAGRGARVARSLLADRRRDAGLPAEVATVRDWRRREDRLDAEWQDRERWREWFEHRLPADASVAEPVRKAEIDRIRETYLTPEEREEQQRRAHRCLAEALDPTAVVEAIDDEALLDGYEAETILAAFETQTLLDVMDDETIRSYLGTGATIGER